MDGTRLANLHRLLTPRHIAVFGGRQAAEVIRQCRRIGFTGPIWPVHPSRAEVEGLPCVRSVAELPAAPDASFIAVAREATVELVAELARRGAGGAVCYASGFAEVGGVGQELQRRLVEAAGAMAIVGPNCYGVLNYLDGAALWPDQHGGTRVERGVALITQSGNIGLNLTMQRRALPLAYVIAVGNKAGGDLHEYIEALLQDPRVSAIGLHIEGLDDVAGFSRAALKALDKGVPLVVLKAGSSRLGAAITLSHTSSLAGADGLYDALFRRLGIARVYDPAALMETLKFLHVHGPLPGNTIASLSCSGGEASLMADLAERQGLAMPPIPEPQASALQELLGEKVHVANPLDYHTYIWGDLAAQSECFAALLAAGYDATLLVLDLPRADRCDSRDWDTTLAAFVAARERSGGRGVVVASLPENLPEETGLRLLQHGIAPLQGLSEALAAIRAAADIGAARARLAETRPLTPPARLALGAPARLLDEWSSKQTLAEYGLTVPQGRLVDSAEAAVTAAAALGYPVVVKAVSEQLAHKTEAGAVKLDLGDAAAVRAAVQAMSHLSDRLLVERMARDGVAELIVGVSRDPQFGLALTVGAGGVLVELLQDAATLLLPVSRAEVRRALASLRSYALLEGYRGRPRGDLEAAVDAVLAVARYAEAEAGRLLELDVNPLLVLPEGRGAVAVDALIRLQAE
ncbi:MAG TPA: acetate--CoA ligase family protein [Roseiflexaceae bacterium]|nr:acetate--CoA ligase family protein [Roseiflexaceae bacterium]